MPSSLIMAAIGAASMLFAASENVAAADALQPAELRTYSTWHSKAVGIEQHGVHVRKEEVFSVPDLPAYFAEPFSSRQLSLKPGSPAVDAGQALPNLCDDFVGAAPDLGVHELGRPEPHFGPRPPPQGTRE